MSETGRVKERKREILRFRATRKTKKKNKKREKNAYSIVSIYPFPPSTQAVTVMGSALTRVIEQVNDDRSVT